MGAGDWNFYDVRFRQEREYTHCSWLMLRPDLEAKAYLRTESQSMSFRDSKQIHSSIPKVYCFDFHTKGTWCQRDQCPYDHGCFKCGKKHPGYTWYNRNNGKLQARDHNSPSHINPSTANHFRKGWTSKLSCLKVNLKQLEKPCMMYSEFWYPSRSRAATEGLHFDQRNKIWADIFYKTHLSKLISVASLSIREKQTPES